MKNTKLLIAAGLVIALAVVGTAYFLLFAKDTVAATVNGQPIMNAAIEEQLELFKQQQPATFSGPDAERQEKTAREWLLNLMITDELVRQEAKRKGIEVSEKEIDDRIEQLRTSIFSSSEDFEKALAESGMTLEELREKVRDERLKAKIQEMVTGKLSVDDAEIEAYYNENPDEFRVPAMLKLRYLVVGEQEDANQILARLQRGADFAEEAKANSLDSVTKESGGDLGWRAPDQLGPESAEGLKGLGPGDLTGVIETQGGFTIYLVEEEKPARQKTLDEVSDELRQRLLAEKQREVLGAWVDELRKKANIQNYG